MHLIEFQISVHVLLFSLAQNWPEVPRRVYMYSIQSSETIRSLVVKVGLKINAQGWIGFFAKDTSGDRRLMERERDLSSERFSFLSEE